MMSSTVISGSPRTGQAGMDQAIARLKESAPVFARLSIRQRIQLAQAMQAGYAGVAAATVAAACQAKRIPAGNRLAGEEWVLGPVITLQNLRLLIDALESLDRYGTTPVGQARRTLDGRVAVDVFPLTRLDSVVFRNVSATVHLDSASQMDARAPFYSGDRHEGTVVLVLGGGNVNAIPPLDVMTKMFNEGKVCLLKMNPVNAYLGPFLETAFAEPIARGFLQVTYGAAEEGAYLARHPGVDEVHLTGSDRTHDALVWGDPGPEREFRRSQDTPLLNKPITSELGNISPVIVVPGEYSPRQLAWQAENIAGGVTNNASFNCNANKMLITSGSWAGRSTLMTAIERVLRDAPARYAYYPGAADRYRALTAGRVALDTFGDERDGTLPWAVIRDLDAADREERAFRIEPFCSVLSETPLQSDDPIEFLAEAVRFANDRLWGTLVATIVVHPAMLAAPGGRDALERAIVDLRYGTVGVNIWGAYGFALGVPWGGHPTVSLRNVQSGLGFVHNTSMMTGVEKTVIRHPLTGFPRPLFFPSHRTAHIVGPRLTALEATGNWLRLPPVLSAALRG